MDRIKFTTMHQVRHGKRTPCSLSCQVSYPDIVPSCLSVPVPVLGSELQGAFPPHLLMHMALQQPPALPPYQEIARISRRHTASLTLNQKSAARTKRLNGGVSDELLGCFCCFREGPKWRLHRNQAERTPGISNNKTNEMGFVLSNVVAGAALQLPRASRPSSIMINGVENVAITRQPVPRRCPYTAAPSRLLPPPRARAPSRRARPR